MRKINFSEVKPISNVDNLAIKKDIYSTISKKNFILGNPVNEFEKKFSKLSKIKYSVGCASGTDALILALMSLNLKKTDEIMVPALTYISTGLSVLLKGYRLIFVDINMETGLISFNDIKKKKSRKTKVIIPVNLYGQKVNLKKLRKIVGKNIKIIEDSAQSHFAYSCFNCKNAYKSKCCKKENNEKYADISCYSFYPSKNLGAYGDGGLVSTNNNKIYKKLLKLRNLGSTKKNMHDLVGLNSRLDTIQAVVLKRKLSTILNLNDDRRKIASFYDQNLENIKQIRITKTKPGSSRHLYVIRTKKRDQLLRYLKRKGIFCQVHYPYSLNTMRIFRNYNKEALLNSEQWSKNCLSLPLFPKLRIVDAKKIIKEVKKYFKSK